MDAAVDDPGPGRLTATDLLRVEVSVPLGIEASFALFTDGLADWWPASSPLREVEATVTLWEPQAHIRVTWAPGATIDVRFAEVDDDLTTVIVEHRHLDAHDPATRALITGDDGWWSVLRAFAAAARARTAPAS
ncbi:hypothetical protein HC251_01485 [Iamia sp. SCSIO 61187]|uniref:hypothetical protein n=1 Tax=Iamia sp. SCSIO 61187 TaxID=2722752 RepID=UPI001C636F6F|nr:hypothetical protein [Iamia sp. SCSIO 61187]QYG91238.1 hypothetical protein HC251_01485 [Iamia sp. SCSIO 61187]